MDILYDAIDSYKRSIGLAFEVDAEIEARSSAYLGKLFYKALVKHQKGRKYYLDCIRILETLKPKVFT